MPKRALPAIRAALERNPEIRISYVEAVAPESYYTRCNDGVETLYVHPVHEATIASLRTPVVSA